jgi:hypothetical protein
MTRIYATEVNFALIDRFGHRHSVSRPLHTIIGAENTSMTLAIQFRKLQVLILYLIVELSSMEKKITDVPFRN